MSIKTTGVEVLPLRGMDQRWLAKSNKARLITDMTWTPKEAWRQAGGFDQMVPDYLFSDIKDSDTVIHGTTVVPTKSADTEATKITGRSEDTSETKPSEALEPERGTVTQRTATDETLKNQKRETHTNKSATGANPYDRHPVPWNMHWFAQYNGAIQYMVYETLDGGMYHFFGAGSPFTPWRHLYHLDGREYNGTDRKRTVLNSWSGTHFQAYGGNLYGVNGYDEPIVFDGRKVSRAGFASKAAGVEADLLHDTDATTTSYAYTEADNFGIGDKGRVWSYRYKVSYVNERGQESPVSELPGTKFSENTSSQRSLLTITLPLGPPGTVARRLYRTQNLRNSNGTIRDKIYGEEYYFLSEIQDNVSRYYVDASRDTSLGALHVEGDYGLWSAGENRIASFKSTVFVANSGSSQVKFSSPGRPEEFPVLNTIEVGDSNAGPIVGMYATRNAIIVFKQRGIYLVKGDPVNGFFSQTLTRDIGCSASKSIREMPGQGLVFLSNDGLYLLEGAFENTGTITGLTRLGEPIEDELKRIGTSSGEAIRSGINQRDREFWLAVPTKGSVSPNRLLKYHYEIGEWSVMPDFEIYDMVATEDHRSYMLLACSSTAAGSRGLMAYSRAYTSKGATTVTPEYKTVFLSPNSLYSSFSPVRCQVYAVGYGDNDLNANIVVNRELSVAYTTNLTRDQKRPLEDANAARYGIATWSAAYKWSEHRPVPIRFDLTTIHKGPVQEMAFNFSPAGYRVQIIGYRLDMRIGSRRETVALTDVFGRGV